MSSMSQESTTFESSFLISGFTQFPLLTTDVKRFHGSTLRFHVNHNQTFDFFFAHRNPNSDTLATMKYDIPRAATPREAAQAQSRPRYKHNHKKYAFDWNILRNKEIHYYSPKGFNCPTTGGVARKRSANDV